MNFGLSSAQPSPHPASSSMVSLCGSGALYNYMCFFGIPVSPAFEVDDLDIVFPESDYALYDYAIKSFVKFLVENNTHYTKELSKPKRNKNSITGSITITDFVLSGNNFVMPRSGDHTNVKISFIRFPTRDNDIKDVIKTYDIDIVQVACPFGDKPMIASESTRTAIKNGTATLLRQFHWNNTIPTTEELEFANSSFRRCIKYQNRGFKFTNGPKIILQSAIIEIVDGESDDEDRTVGADDGDKTTKKSPIRRSRRKRCRKATL